MLPPVTAEVADEGYGVEWIQFSNGHRIYFAEHDPKHHGWCDAHRRNCLFTLTFSERFALQHAEKPAPPPPTRAERLDRALRARGLGF